MPSGAAGLLRVLPLAVMPWCFQVAEELGCDSLHYLSMAGVYEAIGGTRETHCDACFTGEYPLEGSDGAAGKYSLEEEQATTGPSLPLVRA